MPGGEGGVEVVSLLLDIERLELIRVLSKRGVQVWMRGVLRDMHKCPFQREGEWERTYEAYRLCFPGDA